MLFFGFPLLTLNFRVFWRKKMCTFSKNGTFCIFTKKTYIPNCCLYPTHKIIFDHFTENSNLPYKSPLPGYRWPPLKLPVFKGPNPLIYTVLALFPHFFKRLFMHLKTQILYACKNSQHTKSFLTILRKIRIYHISHPARIPLTTLKITCF